jgi:glycosyltransferase involved in cell wall biosynthesis
MNEATLRGRRANAEVATGGPQQIAVMIGQLGQGGSERQLYLFLAHCDRTRWAPTLYVSGELGFWEEPIRELNIPIVLLHGSPLAKMHQFRRACAEQGATRFFSWSSYTNGFGLALAGRGVRRIGSFRNAAFADLPARLRWLWSRMSLAGISVAVCNSRETQARIAGRSAGKPVVFIPNAVQMLTPEQVREQRAKWRARLGLGEGAVLVLGVGRLTPQKNFARFIDTIARARTRAPVQAAIAGGDFGCQAVLQAQIERLDLREAVRLIGKVPDARELMCAADIFLLSSDHEGMPNVVLEAMSVGVPCVATRVNGVGDLIEHGANGFVAEQDAEALAPHVLDLAVDGELRAALGAAARATIEGHYQPEQIVRQLWALCD